MALCSFCNSISPELGGRYSPLLDVRCLNCCARDVPWDGRCLGGTCLLRVSPSAYQLDVHDRVKMHSASVRASVASFLRPGDTPVERALIRGGCESAPHRMRQCASEPTNIGCRKTTLQIWRLTVYGLVIPSLGRLIGVSWAGNPALRGFREQRTPRCVFFRNDALPGRGDHKSSLKDHSREGCDLHGRFPVKELFAVEPASPAWGFCVDRRDSSRNQREYQACLLLC